MKFKDHNKTAFGDIVTDIQKRRDGVFSFQLQINNGLIVGYTKVEKISYRKGLDGNIRRFNT